jgi:hypothetical protein
LKATLFEDKGPTSLMTRAFTISADLSESFVERLSLWIVAGSLPRNLIDAGSHRANKFYIC